MEEFIQNESTTIIKRANDVRPEDATIFERQNKDKENLLQQTVDTKTQDQVARVEHRSQIEPELTESEVENKTNYDKDVTSGEKEVCIQTEITVPLYQTLCTVNAQL